MIESLEEFPCQREVLEDISMPAKCDGDNHVYPIVGKASLREFPLPAEYIRQQLKDPEFVGVRLYTSGPWPIGSYTRSELEALLTEGVSMPAKCDGENHVYPLEDYPFCQCGKGQMRKLPVPKEVSEHYGSADIIATTPRGWECPRCGRCYSPEVKTCPNCPARYEELRK